MRMGNSKIQSQPQQLSIEQQTIIASSESIHSGPLPSPDTLAKYDNVLPGAAERIMNMAEQEALARRENERQRIKHSITIAYIGVIFAFLSVIIVSTLVWYSIYKSFEQTAAYIAVGCIAAVAGVFVFFRRNKKREE